MIATDKIRLTTHISPEVDEKLRIFSIKHRINNLSAITEAALLHCLDNKHFINKISPKKRRSDRLLGG
ncbi:MAG: hypothetical protein LH649_01150 [Pseudanabaena sp. CAN_BIN31]|nr:hypothetical protein [Pseudanabaena sp. CAN_BIN31]